MHPVMNAGTVLVASSDHAGLQWFSAQLAEAGLPMGPGLGQGTGQPIEAVCFETSYDALQAVELILATAPVAGVDLSLALVSFGWGDQLDPVDSTGALTLARCLLAAVPPGAASTCGSAAMVAGPLLGPALELVWTEDVVQGPGNYERVFRIVARGDGTGTVLAPCLEWARRYAAGPLQAEHLSQTTSDAQLPRLTIARATAGVTVESEVARLALQAHARGDVVFRVDGRCGPAGGSGRDRAEVVLLDLMFKQLSQRRAAGPVQLAELRSAPGFACLDDLEAWLRTMVRRAPTTLVVPDAGALDEISRVVIERLLQDSSLSGFSVITSQPGDAVPEVLRQLMSKVRRTETARLQVS